MVKVNTPEASRSPMDGASYEHEGLMHLLAAAAVQRQTHVDDEPSSKPTMWDPVKDCSHTSTTQADLSGFLPDGHSSEQLTHSAVRNLPSMDLDFGYDQAQGDRQQSTNSGFRGAASLGPPPYPRSHTMGLGRFSMDSQIFHISPSYDQSRRRPQENRQPMNMELRTPASTVSNETARPQRSSPCRRTQVPTASLATAASPSTQRGSDQVGIATGHDPQQGNGPPHQSLLATTAMSQALSMAHYGESLDQQSNYTEAARAYDRACALLQEVITRSGSIEEQMECNIARNTYQARLDELSRQSTATRWTQIQQQDDEQEDDYSGRSKAPYSLFEDFALCHKDEEDLSWQEVAELPIFKGKRKHRSLSQRRHTISKMGGPLYHEAERPWTAQEDKRLCSMGNAGKGLGDINRIFPTRNAERCLNRYFQLTGYQTPSKGHGHTSHQALQDPAQSPLGTRSSSAVARHREHRLQSSSSPYQSPYQTLPTFDQHNPSSPTLNTYPIHYTLPIPKAERFPDRDSSFRLPLPTHIPGMPSPSSASAPIVSSSWDNAPSAEPFTPRTQGSSTPSMQQVLATPLSSSSPLYRPTTSSSASSGFAGDTPIFSSSDASATNSPLPKVYDSSDTQSVAVGRARKRRRPVMDEG